MLTENDRLNSPTEMRCCYCEEPVNSDHFPRADEDGSASSFYNDAREGFAVRRGLDYIGCGWASRGDLNLSGGERAPFRLAFPRVA